MRQLQQLDRHTRACQVILLHDFAHGGCHLYVDVFYRFLVVRRH